MYDQLQLPGTLFTKGPSYDSYVRPMGHSDSRIVITTEKMEAFFPKISLKSQFSAKVYLTLKFEYLLTIIILWRSSKQ